MSRFWFVPRFTAHVRNTTPQNRNPFSRSPAPAPIRSDQEEWSIRAMTNEKMADLPKGFIALHMSSWFAWLRLDNVEPKQPSELQMLSTKLAITAIWFKSSKNFKRSPNPSKDRKANFYGQKCQSLSSPCARLKTIRRLKSGAERYRRKLEIRHLRRKTPAILATSEKGRLPVLSTRKSKDKPR